MRTMTVVLPVAILLAAAGLAQAQDVAMQDTGTTWTDTELSKVNEILKLIILPGVAEDARESGVPEEDIRVILREAAKRKLPPAETEIILKESGTAVRENGPVDNFGAFVQAKLGEGLRGRDLSAAIHEEHRLHGKGEGHGKEKGEGHGKEKGKGRAKEKHP